MSDITLIEDLANQNLTEVPEKVLKLPNLKMLYLEGNDIKEIPDNLFKNLKQLTWLDLRNNKLKTLPSSIIYHSNLETLLLQNNKITHIPQEIGFVPKLNVLQLSGNPIIYPEKSILEKGVKAIVKFLQNEYTAEKLNTNSISSTSTYSEANDFNDKEINKIKCVIKEKENENENQKDEIPIITLKSYHRFMYRFARKRDKTRKIKQGIKSKCTIYKNMPHCNSNRSLNMIPKKKTELRIQEQFMKDLWLKNLKEIMTKQQDEIQKEHDQAVLKNWRQTQVRKDIADVKYRPEVPYDYDQEYDQIPTRQELLLKRIEKAQKRIQRSGKTKKVNIDHMINDIIQSLKEMERERSVPKSPADGMDEAGREIKRILAIQKRINTLKLDNDKMF